MRKTISINEKYHIKIESTLNENWFNGKLYILIAGELYKDFDQRELMHEDSIEVWQPLFRKSKWKYKCKKAEDQLVEDIKDWLRWKQDKEKINNNLYESLDELY